MAKRLPPNCGVDLDVPLLYNPYQQAFQSARRMRFCTVCKSTGSMDENGVFVCATCKTTHVNNLTAPRVYDRLLALSGRGGGKTLIGAHAVREELLIPGAMWWIMGPTYKILHDSTFPTLIRLIPPAWVEDWDQEHMELRLKNGSMCAFRSLEDPDRARGPHGIAGGWFDEAAQCPERAYDVFEPTLIKAGGIAICTTTVLGFDWTYNKIEKRALIYKEPGYWACKYWTEENPLFQTNPTMRAQIERAKRTMAPEFYDQEYKAERTNAQGLIYGKLIEKQILHTDQEMKEIIPEWPDISPDRQYIIGLDSGADHPFGAVLIVVTERGLVVVGQYLQRMQAVSQQIAPIQIAFGMHLRPKVKWSSNKNEANLRLEFGLRGIGVIPAENKHEIGIQRVQSWLYSKQLWFAYTCPGVIEQMRAYRYAENTQPDGQKKAKEEVFKKDDEYPDCVRYAIMAWPELPQPIEDVLNPGQRKRMDAFTDKDRADLKRLSDYNKAHKSKDLVPADEHYPSGDFFDGGSEYGADSIF